MNKRIQKIIKTATDITNGKYDARVPIHNKDSLACLEKALNSLGAMVERKFLEIDALCKITEKINHGILLEEILNYTYDSFFPLIPYNRIGLALLEDDGKVLRAHWARSDANCILLTNGYSALMEGSSLQKIIKTGRPRIINDLKAHLKSHPNSDSTKLILEEGIRSSLTCPLIAESKPIGFIFFSSNKPKAYGEAHIELFQHITGQLSSIIEKSRLYQQLLDLNELKSKFLGIAAHDLRSPISLINIQLDLITDGFLGSLTEKQKKSLRGIREWCDRMLALIEDLLDVSAIESGKLHLKKQMVELNPYLDRCIEYNRPLAESKSIRLISVLKNNLGFVSIDPDRIAQVLDNLLSSAIKYAPKDTEITLHAKKTTQNIEISICDQGEGLIDDELSRIFDPSPKGAVKSSRGESSSGLGLSISKKMIDAHEGKTWMENRKPKGTCVHFTFPLKPKNK